MKYLILLLSIVTGFSQSMTFNDLAFVSQNSTVTWSPTNLAGLMIWLKADNGTYTDAGITATINGDSVQQWNDSGTNGINVISISGKPVWETNMINGLPAVHFFGTNWMTNVWSADQAQPNTMFAVAYVSNTALQRVLFDTESSQSGDRNVFTVSGSVDNMDLYAGGTENAYGPSVQDEFCQFTAYFNAASSYIRTNTVNAATVAVSIGTMASGGITLGNRYTTYAANGWSGYIAEFLFYHGTLADADRLLVESYLTNKYRLPTSGTNTFDFLADFESGIDGPVTTTLLSTGSKANQDLLGTWSLSANDSSNSFSFVSHDAQRFQSNYWWRNVLTTDTGTRALAVSFQDTSSRSLHRTFTESLPVSFGVYIVNNLTNTGGISTFWDSFYLGKSGGDAIALEWTTLAPGFYYAHGTSNGVTLNGNYIAGVTTPSTNWITGLVTSSNYTLAVYDPVTWLQVGTNSVMGRTNSGVSYMEFLNWMHTPAYFQASQTNFYDDLVIKKGAVFPLIPTNFTQLHTP